MPRPALPLSARRQRVNLSIPDEAVKILDRMATAQKTTRSALVEELVRAASTKKAS